jgi:hypothetical protein
MKDKASGGSFARTAGKTAEEEDWDMTPDGYCDSTPMARLNPSSPSLFVVPVAHNTLTPRPVCRNRQRFQRPEEFSRLTDEQPHIRQEGSGGFRTCVLRQRRPDS